MPDFELPELDFKVPDIELTPPPDIELLEPPELDIELPDIELADWPPLFTAED